MKLKNNLVPKQISVPNYSYKYKIKQGNKVNNNEGKYRKTVNFHTQKELFEDIRQIAKKREWSFHGVMIRALKIGAEKLKLLGK